MRSVVSDMDRKKLYDELIGIRDSLVAQHSGLAPYMVFGSGQIDLMCQMLPSTPDEMRSLNGCTSFKVNKYGEPFLKAISAFRTAHGITEMPTAPSAPTSSSSTSYSSSSSATGSRPGSGGSSNRTISMGGGGSSSSSSSSSYDNSSSWRGKGKKGGGGYQKGKGKGKYNSNSNSNSYSRSGSSSSGGKYSLNLQLVSN
jgi:hypothetical protein